VVVRARGEYIHIPLYSLSIYLPALPVNKEVRLEDGLRVRRIGYDEVEVSPVEDVFGQSKCTFYYYSKDGGPSEFRMSVFAGRYVSAYYLDYGHLLAAFASRADMIVAFGPRITKVGSGEIWKLNELGPKVEGGGTLPVVNRSVCHSALSGERPVCLTCIPGFRWAIVKDEVVGHYVMRTDVLSEIAKYI